jgi:hypothetical protein
MAGDRTDEGNDLVVADCFVMPGEDIARHSYGS